MKSISRLLGPTISIGWGIGGLAGSAAVCGLFWLVDFSRTQLDFLVLSLYANLIFGVIGAASAIALAAIYACWVTLLAKSWSGKAFVRGLVTLLIGGFVLIVTSSILIISQRPTSFFDSKVGIPIVLVISLIALSTAWVTRPVGGTPDLYPLRNLYVLGALLVAVGVLVPPLFGFVLVAKRGTEKIEPVAVERMPETMNRRLLIVGWDGATWKIIDRLLADGKMNNLRNTLDRGQRSTFWAEAQEIQPFRNSSSGGARSPALWETLATGKMPRQHGIWDFKCTVIPGVQQVIPFRLPSFPFGESIMTTSQMSRSTRIWEILGSVGLSTVVVGWYSTWPVPESTSGILISDRAFLGQATNATTPEGVVEVERILERAFGETERRLVKDGPIPGISPSDWRESESLNTYYKRYARDIAKVEAAEQLLRDFRPDFTAVYLSLIDAAQHKLWRFYEPGAFGESLSPGDQGFDRLIPLSYEIADELLGRLVDAAGDDTSVVILSDHGGGPFVFGGLGSIEGLTLQRTYHPDHSGNHRLDGMMVMSGPQFRSGRKIDDTHHPDLVPTILRFFGLPVAEDMPGRVLYIDNEDTAGPDSRVVASYDFLLSQTSEVQKESEVDDEIQDLLKSLGYVQ
ncbi:alkaline phosphatase family protein [Acidobacteriota bacterium]